MKNSVSHVNRGSTSQVWKPWTVVTVLAGLVDSKFFFFFFRYLQAQPLMKLQPQTLRSHHYLFLFFFSVSLAFSLCIFADCSFCIFSISAIFFVCCFCSFLPPCVFPLTSRVFWSYFHHIWYFRHKKPSYAHCLQWFKATQKCWHFCEWHSFPTQGKKHMNPFCWKAYGRIHTSTLPPVSWHPKKLAWVDDDYGDRC